MNTVFPWSNSTLGCVQTQDSPGCWGWARNFSWGLLLQFAALRSPLALIMNLSPAIHWGHFMCGYILGCVSVCVGIYHVNVVYVCMVYALACMIANTHGGQRRTVPDPCHSLHYSPEIGSLSEPGHSKQQWCPCLCPPTALGLQVCMWPHLAFSMGGLWDSNSGRQTWVVHAYPWAISLALRVI